MAASPANIAERRNMSDVKLNPCPFCGSTKIQSECYSTTFSIAARAEDCFDYCKDCDAQGPAGGSAAEAHVRWNARGPAAAPGS
jgi:Lar family restriction alleviation protein